MGGSSKGGVPNSQIQAGELQNQNALTAIAQNNIGREPIFERPDMRVRSYKWAR